MLTLVIIFFIFISLALLARFAIADGDSTLMSKGPTKREHVEGKVVWITGASRGIGESLARQFASLGANLILSSRNVSELERVKNEIVGKYAPARVEVLPLDLASGGETLSEAVQKAESFFGGAGVDYMVHNAAYERPKRNILEGSREDLEDNFRVNVFGTINLTWILAPFMLKRGNGHFVLISSGAGKCPAPGFAMYCATKHALQGYFHTLRSELCQKGIKVTLVCPGQVDTSKTASSKKKISSERCAELTIVAATHGLKEAWISYQPILFVMYVVQYMPTIGYWLIDKMGAKSLEAVEGEGSTFNWRFFLGQKDKLGRCHSEG